MNLVNDERGRLGEARSRRAFDQPQEPALLTDQERVARGDESGERRIPGQELTSPLEGRHVVVFPDRHLFVEIADHGLPPADHPAAGLAEQGEPGLLDQPVVCRPLVGPDADAPLTVDPRRIARRGGFLLRRGIVAARRRDNRRQRQERPRGASEFGHVRVPKRDS